MKELSFRKSLCDWKSWFTIVLLELPQGQDFTHLKLQLWKCYRKWLAKGERIAMKYGKQHPQ